MRSEILTWEDFKECMENALKPQPTPIYNIRVKKIYGPIHICPPSWFKDKTTIDFLKHVGLWNVSGTIEPGPHQIKEWKGDES